MDGKVRTLDLLCIRRACIVGVDLFCCGRLVERDEAMKKVVAGGVVVVTAVVVGEVVPEW